MSARKINNWQQKGLKMNPKSFKIIKLQKKSDATGEVIPGETMPEHGDPNEPAELGESSKPGEELYNIPEDLEDLQLEHLPEIMVMVNRESKAAIERNGVQTMDIRDWYLALAEEIGEVADAIREDNKDEVTIELVQAAVIALKMAESIMYGENEHEESDSVQKSDAIPSSVMGDNVKILESKTGKNNGMKAMLFKGLKGFYVILHDNETDKNGCVRKFSPEDEKAARAYFGSMKVADVFESKAQQRYLFAKEPEVAKEFAAHTSENQFEKLPEYKKKSDEDCKAINAAWKEADGLPQEDEGREAKITIIKDKFEKLVSGAYLSEEQKQIALREFDKSYLIGV